MDTVIGSRVGPLHYPWSAISTRMDFLGAEDRKLVEHAIGFDFGTSGLKGLLVDATGTVLAHATRPYATRRPHAGWSQQDPEDWWRSMREVGRELTADRPRPDAVGLTGHMHAPVLLDAAGTVLAPAILWNDQRSVLECEDIDRLTGGEMAEWTGNPVRTAFTASKLLWLRRHRPDIHARIGTMLLPKDFIRFRLTGSLGTDASDASGTNLFDVRMGGWSEKVLDALKIPAGWLPPVDGSASIVGRVTEAAASHTGLPAGAPVVAGASDQAAAAIGSGIVAPGALAIGLGTSAAASVAMARDMVDPTGACHTFRHGVPDAWQMMGGVLSAGGAMQWFHDRIASGAPQAGPDMADGHAKILAGARTVVPGAEGLIFLPYLTGQRTPYNDPYARGGWIGLTARHDNRHLARAILEGVCFALRQVVEGIEAIAGPAEEVRIVGGGARGGLWPEIMASVLARPLRPVATPDASAHGAAMLAMSGLTGAGMDVLAREWVPRLDAIDPVPAAVARYDEMRGIFDSLYPATRDAMHLLSNIDHS